MRYEWDDGNVEHIAGKGVEPDEAEEALEDPRNAGLPTYNGPDEQRWATIGRTSKNRFLIVVFTRRQGRIRVVTARDATEDEKRTYRRRRGK
jgi:uncharacterized DUF497 family protein